jgi:predicted phosphodiesterase
MGLPANFHSGKLSLFQSAVHKTIVDNGGAPSTLSAEHPMMQQATTVLTAASADENLDKFTGTALECASLTVQAAFAAIGGDAVKAAEIQAQLQDSPCDPGWVTVLATYLDYYADGKEPQYTNWTNIGDFVYAMPDQGAKGPQLTIGILADWGTGDPRVAASSLKALIGCSPDLIIHLGDIYYAGTSHECQEHFLQYINDARAAYPVPVWNLAGNHDYYSGGGPYYDLLTQLNAYNPASNTNYVRPGTPVQEASFFCLRNKGWQIQAMDTGFYDHDVSTVNNDTTRLHDSEVAWHLDKIDSANGRKIVLLSHHQLYSAFEQIGTGANNYYNPSLLQSFETQLNSGDIVAWLWGHEHLLEMYKPFPLLNPGKQPMGRCVGYSAFPMLKDQNPYATRVSNDLVAPLGNPPFLQTTGDVFNHGFTILTLADSFGQAEYYEIPGDGSACKTPLRARFAETLWSTEAAAAGG